jgi:hypothetical protein
MIQQLASLRGIGVQSATVLRRRSATFPRITGLQCRRSAWRLASS